MKTQQAIEYLLSMWTSPMYVMMVGVPGVGKSTFINKLMQSLNDRVYIASTDNILEDKAKNFSITYSEMFNQANHKQIKQQMEDEISIAIKKFQSIINDQTNMSQKTRVSKLQNVPDSYYKVCLDFTVDHNVLMERLNTRAALTGKIIPEYVIQRMFSSYNQPSTTEGFDFIIEVDNT